MSSISMMCVILCHKFVSRVGGAPPITSQVHKPEADYDLWGSGDSRDLCVKTSPPRDFPIRLIKGVKYWLLPVMDEVATRLAVTSFFKQTPAALGK